MQLVFRITHHWFCANLVIRKFLKLTTFSVVWQFETSAFHMVVLWHTLNEVKNECTYHNFSLFAISLPKIFKIGRNLTKFWQIQICLVFETRCSLPMRLDFFVKLKKWSSTLILSVGIKYSLRDLLFDVKNYAWPTRSDMRHIRYMTSALLLA